MVELVNLNEDITLAILLYCDVFSILKMEQTCRYLRKVSLYRHLWLTLVTNLDYDHAPNLLPHESLQSLSTDRLREMVIRSTRSYLNWTRPQGPRPTRSISFEIPARSVEFDKLLPGGKYFVVLDCDGRFYCYDTDSQEQIFSYTGTPPDDEQIQQIDCILVNEGNTLVLAYGAMRLEDLQISLTVVRFNIHYGTSEIVRKFTFGNLGDTNRPIMDVVIGPEIVVVQECWRTLVCNWRTGQATVIAFEKNLLVSFSSVVFNHLCIIHGTPGSTIDFTAIPLTTIFRDRGGCDSRESSASTPYTYVRSEDIFRGSINVTMVAANDWNSYPFLESVSLCTGSWKTPSMCEHDVPATPTRIILLVDIISRQHMAFELLFSPASTTPSSRPSLSSIDDDTPQNRYVLTYLRQSLPLSYRRKGLHICYLTSGTRAGHLFAIYGRTPAYREVRDSRPYTTAINMPDALEEMSAIGTATSIRSELFMGRAARTSPMDRLLDKEVNRGNAIKVETYSGAMWYRSGSTLFIHHTD